VTPVSRAASAINVFPMFNVVLMVRPAGRTHLEVKVLYGP
jgi:hypothetical protein